MSGWRRNGILVIFAICICTLIIGRRHLEENGLYLKTPKPTFHLEVVKNGNYMKQKSNTSLKLENGLKTILFYTPFFHMIDYEFGFGHQPFIDFDCPISNCYTTNDKNALGKSSSNNTEFCYLKFIEIII